MSLHGNIKIIRENKGLTTKQISKKLKMFENKYIELEKGLYKPNTGLLNKIADIFNMTINEIENYNNNEFQLVQTKLDIKNLVINKTDTLYKNISSISRIALKDTTKKDLILRKPRLMTLNNLIEQAEILNTDTEINADLENEKDPYDGYELTDNTISPRLVNFVESYKYKGELKTLFYTEVNTNLKVGDRVFIINGNYDSDLLIKENKYKKYRDGYRVLFVDKCKVVLDINYDENNVILPYKDDDIDEFINVYTIEDDNDFLLYNRWITTRGNDSSNTILDYKFTQKQNTMVYSKITTTITASPNEWGVVGNIFANNFYVRVQDTNSASVTWDNININMENGGLTTSLAYNPSYGSNDRLLIHGYFTHSISGKIVEFNDGEVYKWDDDKYTWVIDVEYYKPILTKSNFRDGLFRGEFNSGLYGRSDKKIKWSNAKWNLGTLLNTHWLDGVMNSKYTLKDSYISEIKDGIARQKTTLPNNNSWGYNYIYDSQIKDIKIEGANIEHSIIGVSNSQSNVYNYLIGTQSSYSFEIRKSKIKNTNLINGRILTSDVIGSYNDNVLISESKSINSHFTRSVMEESKIMNNDDIKILDYEILDDIGMNNPNGSTSVAFVGYKFHISKDSYEKLKLGDTFYIKDLNINHNYPMNFFDKKFYLSSKTNFIDYYDSGTFKKEGIEYVAYLSTPKDNTYNYTKIPSGIGSEITTKRNKEIYSIDIIVFNRRIDSGTIPFTYKDVPLSELSKNQFISPEMDLDISKAFITKGDFDSGYITSSEWIAGNHIEDNNDINIMGNNISGTYSITIDNYNLIIDTNKLNPNVISGESVDIKENDIVYLNNISHISASSSNVVNLNDTYRVLNDDYATTGQLILEDILGTQSIAGITQSGDFLTIGAHNRYGYTHKLKINKSKINSGVFRRSYITNTIIQNDDYNSKDKTFRNIPNLRKLIISDSIFKNTKNKLSKSTYMYSAFVGGNDEFIDGIVYRSIWNGLMFNNGVFKKSSWYDGIFNNGEFYENNDFELYSGNYYDNIRNSYYISGSLSNDRYSWRDGEFKNGEFYKSNWEAGTFNLGKFFNSDFYSGTIKNGVFGDINIPNDKTRVFNAIIEDVKVENANFIADRINMTQSDVNMIKWHGGIFNNGVFGANGYYGGTYSSNQVEHISIWEDGLFNGGVFNGNSKWKNGTFNGGRFESLYGYEHFKIDNYEWISYPELNLITFNNYSNTLLINENIVIELDVEYGDERDIFNGAVYNVVEIDNDLGYIQISVTNSTLNDNSSMYGKFARVDYIQPFNKADYAWEDGVFNNGIFGNGKIINSTWYSGEFNGGEFKGKLWNNGVFSYGKFIGSGGLTPSGGANGTYSNAYTYKEDYKTLYYGLWKDGVVTNKKDKAIKNKKFFTELKRYNYVEPIRRAEFENMLWESGTFSHTSGFINKSLWLSGTFENGTFENSSFNPYVIRSGSSASFDWDSKWINGNLKDSDFYISEWKNGIFDKGNAYGMVWRDGVVNYMNAYNIYWENGLWRNGNWNGSYIKYNGEIDVDTFYNDILTNVGSASNNMSEFHIWNLFKNNRDGFNEYYYGYSENKVPSPIMPYNGKRWIDSSNDWTLNTPYSLTLNYSSDMKTILFNDINTVITTDGLVAVTYKHFDSGKYYLTYNIDDIQQPIHTIFDISTLSETLSLDVNFTTVTSPVDNKFRVHNIISLTSPQTNIADILKIEADYSNAEGVKFKEFYLHSTVWNFTTFTIFGSPVDGHSTIVNIDNPTDPNYNTTGWSYDIDNKQVNCFLLSDNKIATHLNHISPKLSDLVMATLKMNTSKLSFNYTITSEHIYSDYTDMFTIWRSYDGTYIHMGTIQANGTYSEGRYEFNNIPIGSQIRIIYTGDDSSPDLDVYLTIKDIIFDEDYHELNNTIMNYSNDDIYALIPTNPINPYHYTTNTSNDDIVIVDGITVSENVKTPAIPLNTLVGNGIFKAGIWENGIWNSGYRHDEMSEIFYDIDPFNTYRIESDVKWRVRIIGPSTSVAKFNESDDITIANIIGININEERKLLKDAYKIIKKKNNSTEDFNKGWIDIFIETTFPLMRIEKDSNHHRIKITKNIWLNGLLNNGLWENGIWNNGTINGFPKITEMFDNYWIDGVFSGGHFKNKKLYNFNHTKVISYSPTIDNTIQIELTSPHNLTNSDIIHIRETGTASSFKEGEYNIKVIDDYTIEVLTPYVEMDGFGFNFSPMVHSAVIQNMNFYDNNASDIIGDYRFNSWMDIQYYKESGINILKDETVKLETMPPLTREVTYNEPNLYGYPTLDVLSSVSEMSDTYKTGKRKYKLGTKYKEYHDFVGDASRFEDYFNVFEDPQVFYDLGWDYIHSDTAWHFDDYYWTGVSVSQVGLTTYGYSNKEIPSWFTDGTIVTIRLNEYYGDDRDQLNGTYSITLNGTYSLILDGSTWPVNAPATPGVMINSTYSFELIDDFAQTDGFTIKRHDSKEILQIHINSSVEDNNIYIDLQKPENRIFNRYDNSIEKRRYSIIEFDIEDETTYSDAYYNINYPIIYFNNKSDNTPINGVSKIVNHLLTYKKRKVEYFYNRRNLMINFKGGLDGTGEIGLYIDNLKYKEVNMIPFFDYYNKDKNEDNINTNIAAPNYGSSIYEIKFKKTYNLLNNFKITGKLNP